MGCIPIGPASSSLHPTSQYLLRYGAIGHAGVGSVDVSDSIVVITTRAIVISSNNAHTTVDNLRTRRRGVCVRKSDFEPRNKIKIQRLMERAGSCKQVNQSRAKACSDTVKCSEAKEARGGITLLAIAVRVRRAAVAAAARDARTWRASVACCDV